MFARAKLEQQGQGQNMADERHTHQQNGQPAEKAVGHHPTERAEFAVKRCEVLVHGHTARAAPASGIPGHAGLDALCIEHIACPSDRLDEGLVTGGVIGKLLAQP